MRQHNAAFANFVCHFGEKVLLDYAEEIVTPAFMRDYVRTHGERTVYRFHEVEYVRLGAERGVPVLALAGRFIKDTLLTRHQVFNAEVGLVHDEQSMPSAPSAYFVLILNNHRLIYFPETPHAPDFRPFEATCRRFLKDARREYVDELYREGREGGERVTKKALYDEHRAPTLEVIPLAGQESVEEFMRRYAVLKRIDFRLIRPNDDIVAADILAQLRGWGDEMNSDSVGVSMANGQGLDIDAGVDAVVAATGAGNQRVTLNGVDRYGNKLSGNNEQFHISSEMGEVPSSDAGLRERLYQMLRRAMRRGTVQGGELDAQREKMRELERRM